jgi:hypothetical protein
MSMIFCVLTLISVLETTGRRAKREDEGERSQGSGVRSQEVGTRNAERGAEANAKRGARSAEPETTEEPRKLV